VKAAEAALLPGSGSLLVTVLQATPTKTTCPIGLQGKNLSSQADDCSGSATALGKPGTHATVRNASSAGASVYRI